MACYGQQDRKREGVTFLLSVMTLELLLLPSGCGEADEDTTPCMPQELVIAKTNL